MAAQKSDQIPAISDNMLVNNVGGWHGLSSNDETRTIKCFFVVNAVDYMCNITESLT